MSLRRRLVVFVLMQVVSMVEAAVNLQRPFNNSISALFVFGDSTVDSGNNNYIGTPFKSNFPPYGRDFPGRIPTGRFCDGRLVTDFIASYVGIKELVPPYLDPTLKIEELLTGVCFASAGSGFDPFTAQLLGVIPIEKQLEYFKEYKSKVEMAVGKERTKRVISKAAFLISAGTNDIVINYYGTPFRRLTYDIATYEQLLLRNVQQFIQGLREEGAQLIGVVGLPPIGCMPIVITLTSGNPIGGRHCSDSLSSIALGYNHKLQHLITTMQDSTSILAYADIYKPLDDMIKNASRFGLNNVNAGCCGSGLVETSFICNPGSAVCQNPSKYMFFDSVHPSQAAYHYLFQALRPTIDHFLKNI